MRQNFIAAHTYTSKTKPTPVEVYRATVPGTVRFCELYRTVQYCSEDTIYSTVQYVGYWYSISKYFSLDGLFFNLTKSWGKATEDAACEELHGADSQPAAGREERAAALPG